MRRDWADPGYDLARNPLETIRRGGWLMTDDDQLGDKYRIARTDGRSVEGQEFFVLRIDPASEDIHAIAAATAYAQSCWHDRPALSRDLDRKISEWRRD